MPRFSKILAEAKIRAPRNRLITDAQYAFEEYMKGNVSLKDLIDTAGSVENIATKKDIDGFVNNKFMIRMQADEMGVSEQDIVKRAKALRKLFK